MYCQAKKCPSCAHWMNLRTHPLFEDFELQDRSGKTVKFEGCVFHFQTLLMRQIWVSLGGVQAAVESGRNELSRGLGQLGQGVMKAVEIDRLKLLGK